MYFFVAKLLSNAQRPTAASNHLRSLRPMIQLICYAHSAYTSMQCYRRAHDARPHCRLKSLFSGTRASTRIIFILPETSVPELHEGCYSYYWSICIYFYAIVFESQENVFKTSVNARPYCPLTSPF